MNVKVNLGIIHKVFAKYKYILDNISLNTIVLRIGKKMQMCRSSPDRHIWIRRVGEKTLRKTHKITII